MSSRRRRRDSPSEAARRISRPDARLRPAASHPFDDLLSSRPPVARQVASATQRVDTYRSYKALQALRSVRAALPRQARQTPARAISFGAWSLDPSFFVPEPLKRVKELLVCPRRAIRREVMFALRLRGAGSGARKKHYSNWSCK